MIAEGQEFARSKVIARTAAPDPKVGRVDDNSYEKDNATNYLDYHHAELNSDLVEYYAGLVALRRANPAFGGAPRSAVAFLETGNDRAIAYTLEVPDGGRFLVALNGDPSKRLALELPAGRWTVVANARSVSPTRSLGTRTGRALVAPTSALILRQRPRARAPQNLER
jgi:pullulanase/glycogen debranching enzyme